MVDIRSDGDVISRKTRSCKDGYGIVDIPVRREVPRVVCRLNIRGAEGRIRNCQLKGTFQHEDFNQTNVFGSARGEGCQSRLVVDQFVENGDIKLCKKEEKI